VRPKAGFRSDALAAIIHDLRAQEVPRASDSNEIGNGSIQSVFGNAINDDAGDHGSERMARDY
jgi:hypothetical protein